jgi:hypothetical protein
VGVGNTKGRFYKFVISNSAFRVVLKENRKTFFCLVGMGLSEHFYLNSWLFLLRVLQILQNQTRRSRLNYKCVWDRSFNFSETFMGGYVLM